MRQYFFVLLLTVGMLGTSVPATADGDTAAPTLESLAVQGDGTFTPGETVTVEFALDDATTSGEFQAIFTTPTGGQRTAFTWLAGSTGTATLDVGAAWPDGTYALERVFIADAANNFTTYHRDGTVDTAPSGVSGPSSHDLDFSTRDFEVDNPDGDTAAPTLESLAVQGDGTFTPGETVTVEFALDDATTSGEFQAIFTTPTGGQRTAFTWLAGSTGTATLDVGAAWPDGTYALERVFIADAANNFTTYHRDGTVDTAPSGVSGPSSHDLDFSTRDFEVDNPDGDTAAPTLESLAVQGDGTFTPGETVTVEFALDDATTSGEFQAIFTTPTGGQRTAFTWLAGSTGTATLDVGAAWPDGTYALERVFIADAANNFTTYHRDGTVDTAPSGVSGPSSHDLDFFTRDFEVRHPDDATPPETTITGGPAEGSSTTSDAVDFSFASSEVSSSFSCRVDGGDWTACTSPTRVSGLTVGEHTFSVVATDFNGNQDPTPATRTFTRQAASSGGGGGGGTSPPPDEEPSPEPGAATDPYDGVEPGTPRDTSSACGEAPDTDYPDADGTHAGAIDCATFWSLLTGKDDGSFEPAGNLIRGQMATVIVRALEAARGSELPAGDDRFDDDDGTTHEVAINKLAEAGLLAGTDDGTAAAGTPISRGQFALLLVRSWQWILGEPMRTGTDSFTDDDGTVYEDSLNRLSRLGIYVGDGSGSGDPAQHLSRAQAASLLVRWVDALVDAGALTRKS